MIKISTFKGRAWFVAAVYFLFMVSLEIWAFENPLGIPPRSGFIVGPHVIVVVSTFIFFFGCLIKAFVAIFDWIYDGGK